MKNNMKRTAISLKLLSHKILRIKANAFLKLVLYTESTDIESASQENDLGHQTKAIVKCIERIAQFIQRHLVRNMFDKIKLAGWKLIPEAHAQEQQDSPVSIKYIDKLSTSEVTLLPASAILRDITNFPHSSQLSWSGVSPILRSKANSKHISYQQITIDTSRSSQSELKKRKRALILKKLQNVEMCVNYIQFQSNLADQARKLGREWVKTKPSNLR